MKRQITSYSQKNLDLYLMKIQIRFLFKKFFRSIFNENTDPFCCCSLKKKEGVFSNLLQISKFNEELNLKRVNQLLNNILNV